LKRVIIIGGGLAGLVSAYRLARKGFECIVIEKKHYPFHRVCGEYISNEVVPFLRSEDLYPETLRPIAISTFQLSSVSGKISQLPLDVGGFGISRYAFDNFLYERAIEAGVTFLLDTEVEALVFDGNNFSLKTNRAELSAPLVIGSFGKRSKLDAQLSRNYFKKRSPYVGVKYHVRIEHPLPVIALHNFRGGYCGVSNVENGITNVCYLTHRDNLKKYKSIPEMEEEVLFENPHLRKVFEQSEILFNKPETINEISFETKEPVWNHVLMVGDAAGMIAPLCGNGMSMAIHSAKILTEVITKHGQGKTFKRNVIESEYTELWRKNFARRLWVGRHLQHKLFGHPLTSNLAVNLAIYSKAVARFIMKNTHGEPF
jgi:menaquinone-9 beta-reductase